MTGRRSGRRAGESGTRAAILEAARRRFGQHGYDGATIRGIAADAGVDPALVHHFYGTKERLFAAAMRLPVVPSELISAALAAERGRLGDEFPAHIGEVLLRAFLAGWGVADVRAVFLGVLRSAVSNDQAVTMIREFVTRTVLTALSEGIGTVADTADPVPQRFRAALVASQMVGVAFARYVLELEPMASASADELVAAIGPTIQRYLTGDVTSG